ncbi:MAG: VOC family protein [Rhodobacteraceae bacterium]|nr:VOC family protein [Paracoccaceae bacterium]
MPGWKPDLYPSLSPYLICPEAEALIAFLGAVFGGRLLRRFERPDGSVMHAEVLIDDSVVMIGGGETGERTEGPHLHLYVRDVDALYARAQAAGAEPVQEPVRKTGDDDRRAGFRDGFGIPGGWPLSPERRGPAPATARSRRRSPRA